MSEKTCNCDPCLEWLVPHDAEVTAIERERIIQVLLNNTSEINLMLNGEIIRLDAWDKTPKFAEQTLRQLFEGENK